MPTMKRSATGSCCTQGALTPTGRSAGASKKLRSDESLVTALGSTILRKYLDEVPLWGGGGHVAVRQLVEDFARYLYLPRLVGCPFHLIDLN